MTDAPTTDNPTEETAEDRSRLLERTLNRVVSMNADLARRHVERFGGGKTGEELLVRLDRQYRLAVTGSSAAVGATAAVPGVGTVASVALSGAQTVGTLEATMLYVLSYAEATGVEIDDVRRRRMVLMTVLLGPTGQSVVEKIIGTSDLDWGTLLTRAMPSMTVMQRLERELRRRFLARFGTAALATSAARMLPFGAGAAVGGIAGAVSSAAVIKTTRRLFAS